MSTALTRIPSGPSSFERVLVKAIPAARATEVGEEPAGGALPAVARTFTIEALARQRAAEG